MLNAYFEDQAEHEYIGYVGYVAERPALESEPFESTFAELGSLERVATARLR